MHLTSSKCHTVVSIQPTHKKVIRNGTHTDLSASMFPVKDTLNHPRLLYRFENVKVIPRPVFTKSTAANGEWET